MDDDGWTILEWDEAQSIFQDFESYHGTEWFPEDVNKLILEK